MKRNHLLQRAIGDQLRGPEGIAKLATALALAGVTPAVDKPLDGVNLLPYFSGQKSSDPHEILFWRMKARRIWAVRMGDWKLVAAHGWHDIPASVTKPRLINLAEDIGEKNDLSEKFPDKVKELKDALSQTVLTNFTALDDRVDQFSELVSNSLLTCVG